MTESIPKEGDIVRPGKFYGKIAHSGVLIDYSRILGIVVGIDQQREPKTWLRKGHVLVYWFNGAIGPGTAINDTICCRYTDLRLYLRSEVRL